MTKCGRKSCFGTAGAAGSPAPPEMVQAHGIGTGTAAEMLILAGDNPERIRSEAAFAKLCGARRAAAIPMIAKTKNMRRYGKDSWLTSQSSANPSPGGISLLLAKMQGDFEKMQRGANCNRAKSVHFSVTCIASRSGCGDQIAFLTNLERWASTRDVELIQRSSLEVSPEEIIARVGKCRIFSVDAGHTEECTVNDLYLAEAAAADHGIIILDDFFNAYWPDVSTGTARYLLDAKTTMRPFAISPNKVYLAPRAFHHKYQSELRLSQEDFYEKNSRMFGHEVMIFGADPVTFDMTHRIKKAIRKSAVGPYALRLKQLLRKAADKKRSRMWARSHLDRR